jgi:delta24(24(1))-sterol reductase
MNVSSVCLYSFYEKDGWMLIFWNFAGVPYVYTFQSIYILRNGNQLSAPFAIGLIALLLFAYYMWDTANSQKNRFRMIQRGTYIPRRTFPQLPWGTLTNPQVIKTKHGDPLLVDGWYKYARKAHYTGDILMGTPLPLTLIILYDNISDVCMM